MKAPFKAHVFIEKFDRGQWNSAIFDRQVADFCLELQNPSMPWYAITSLFSKKQCPFPAGHVEKITKGGVKEVPEGMDRSFIGKYRFNFDSTFLVGLKIETDCFRGSFELIE